MIDWPPRLPVALGDRSLFPQLEARAYLSHCAISPISSVVERAIESVTRDYASRGVAAFTTWHERRHQLRERVATLLGGETDEIGFVANTTTGISTIALCYPWRIGDTVVLVRGEFPGNVTPWLRAAELHGLRVEFLAVEDFAGPSGDGLAKLEARLSVGGVRLIACSAVQFQTGLRMPLAEMAALAHRHGAELFCDAIQALGALEFDVRGLGLDYVSCGSHKWLMGVEGCALLWIARERMSELRPHTAGWLSHEHAIDFLFEPDQLRYDRPIRARADFVEAGAYPTIGLAALAAAIEPLLELGVARIEAHVSAYLDRLEPELIALGLVSLRSAIPAQRSGILTLRPPAGHDARAVQAALHSCGISMTIPEGLLRFGPHWPNDPGEIPAIVAAMGALVTP